MTYKDYITQDEVIDRERDERWTPYLAGFNKAKEVFSTKGLITRITDPGYHFQAWREEQDAGNQRVDL